MKSEEDRAKWILQYESGRQWYTKLNSPSTIRPYVRNLQSFCSAVEKNPDELIEMKLEGLKSIGTPKEFQAETTLELYLASVKSHHVRYATKTAVMSFYKHNRRELRRDTANNVSMPNYRKRSPEIKDIMALERVMINARDRFLAWFLPTTAVRVKTLTELVFGDLKPTGDSQVPYEFIIESARLKGRGLGRYRGIEQHGFISAFVAERLKEYRAEAERKGYVITPQTPLFIAYYSKGKAVKGIGVPRLEAIMANASLNAFGNLKEKRFSIDDFRDVLQSGLERAGVNENLIAPLLSHKVKGVDSHYSNHCQAEYREAFKQAIPYLQRKSPEELEQEHHVEHVLEEDQKEQELKALKEEMKALRESYEKLLPLTRFLQEPEEHSAKDIVKAFGGKRKHATIELSEDELKLIGEEQGLKKRTIQKADGSKIVIQPKRERA